MTGHTFAWYTADDTTARSLAWGHYWWWKLQKLLGRASPAGLTLVPITHAIYLAHQESGTPCTRRQCRAVAATIWHAVDGPRMREL